MGYFFRRRFLAYYINFKLEEFMILAKLRNVNGHEDMSRK